ncbi:thiamine diphosphokinase [Actibacterium sp. D379-3]
MVTLLGGGEIAPKDLAEALTLAPVLVAADGGADAALAAGHMPEAVIGDFDSISAATRAALPPARMHLIGEQESTDFDKCLRSISAPLILGLGFMGARLDHLLAALTGLTRRPGAACILIGRRDIAFLCPPHLSLRLEPGTRLSLFPMGAVQGRSRGLKWPIEGLAFAPDGRIGTSNEVVEPEVVLDLSAPCMVAILPRTALGAAIAALRG